MKIQQYTTDLNCYKQPLYLIGFFIFAAIQMVATSCIIYGYSSLLVIFKDMKLYQRYCNDDVTVHNNSSTIQNTTTVTFQCYAQDKALNLPFAYGTIINCLVKILIGNIIDKIGARSSQYVACILIMIFGISLSFVEEEKEYLIYVAFTFLGLATSTFMLCPYQIVNIFYKKHKSLLMSILSGSVDGSTMIFILFLDMYQEGLSLSKIVLGYSVIVAILIILVTTFMYPSKHVLIGLVDDDVRENLSPKQLDKRKKLHPEDFTASHMSSYSLYQESIQRSFQELDEAEKREALLASLSHSLAKQWSQSSNFSTSKETSQWVGGKYGTITENVPGYGSDDEVVITTSYFDKNENVETEQLLSDMKNELSYTNQADLSLCQHLVSGLFLVSCYAFSIFQLKLIYFIGNLDKYLLGMTDFETATWYTRIFGYVQVSSIFVSPMCSLLFTKRNKVEVNAEDEYVGNLQMLMVPSVVGISLLILLNSLQMVGNIHLSIPVFILFLTGNTLTWCYMAVYFALLFPAKYYCTLLGINSGLIGTFSVIQYPLLYLEQNVFEGKQFYTNFIFLILLLSTAVLPLYLLYFYMKISRLMKCKTLRSKDDNLL